MRMLGWLRASAAVLVMLAAGCAAAADADASPRQKHERGEFHFFTGPAPAWVEPEQVPARWDEQRLSSAGASWRYWLFDGQRLRVGGQRARYADTAYEPTTAAGLGEAGKAELSFNPEFERLVIHEISVRRDGRWLDRLKPEAITLARRETEFERDMAVGTVSAMIVLDDLRLGDVVRLRSTVEGSNPVMAGLDDENGVFALGVPVLRRSLSVRFDTGVKVSERRDAAVPQAEVRKLADAVQWRYRAEYIAALTSEDRVPRWHRQLPSVRLSEARSWAEVAAWARTLYPPPQALPEDLQQRIAQWRALPDTDSRIAAALRAVQDEVRYFGVEIGENTHKPAEPAQVWNLRRGDCKDKSRLLVAILAALDVEARPALVSAGDGRAIRDEPPSAAAFDHVIVQVPRPGATLWLDPTSSLQRGPVRAEDTGDFGFALPVAAAVRDLVAVERNPDYASRTSLVERYVPAAEGTSVKLEISAEYIGEPANLLRHKLRSGGREQTERSYADYYRRRFGELDVAAPLRVEEDDARNRLVVHESYTLANPWAPGGGGGVRAIDLVSDNISGMLTLPDNLQRRSPLALQHPVAMQGRIEMVLPQGWRWQGRAGESEFKDAAGIYRYRAGQEGSTLYSQEELSTSAASVAPERLAEHLRWRRAARDQNGQRWVLAVPSAQAAQDRDARLNGLLRGLMDDNSAGNNKAKNGNDDGKPANE
jgi:transglutaminase-like putative cysteine protease